MTRHCHRCGWNWTLGGPPGRSETCHQCGADLKVCLNCVSYDARSAHQCRDRRADPVMEKDAANFCEYFEFVSRVFSQPQKQEDREIKARNELRKLFGE